MLTVEFVPTYEYECPQCQRIWEVRQRISEPALTTCDQCGGAIRRLLSAAPFILKGGGWYVTDYPSESRKKAMSSTEGGGEKAPGDKSAGDKSAGDKSAGDKSAGDKSAGDKPAGGGEAKTATDSKASPASSGGDGGSSKDSSGKSKG
jgi:putative FmdB family regulatory protein